jgi:hypothetical protein
VTSRPLLPPAACCCTCVSNSCLLYSLGGMNFLEPLQHMRSVQAQVQ